MTLDDSCGLLSLQLFIILVRRLLQSLRFVFSSLPIVLLDQLELYLLWRFCFGSVILSREYWIYISKPTLAARSVSSCHENFRSDDSANLFIQQHCQSVCIISNFLIGSSIRVHKLERVTVLYSSVQVVVRGVQSHRQLCPAGRTTRQDLDRYNKNSSGCE